MVLDALIKIKNEVDPTLTFRRSCREGSFLPPFILSTNTNALEDSSKRVDWFRNLRLVRDEHRGLEHTRLHQEHQHGHVQVDEDLPAATHVRRQGEGRGR